MAESTFLDPYKANFDVLLAAAEAGDLCLMECTDKRTGEKVAVVCAVDHYGDEVVFVPFARMFDGNPYEELLPPTTPTDDPSGGDTDARG